MWQLEFPDGGEFDYHSSVMFRTEEEAWIDLEKDLEY